MKSHVIMRENPLKNSISKFMDKLKFRNALAEEESTETTKAEDTTTGDEDTGENDAPDFELLKDKKVSKLVQHARTEEKSKVHKDLDKAKAKVSALEGEIRDLTSQVGQVTVENTKLKADLADAIKQGEMSADDKVKAIQEKLTKAEADLATVTGELTVARAKLDSTVLEGYKKSKIEEAGGKVIEELVNGSTTEEIDASIEKAKTAYAKYHPETTTTTQTETTPPETTPTKPVVTQPMSKPSTGVTGTPARTTNESDFTGFGDLLKNPREAKKRAQQYGEVRKQF